MNNDPAPPVENAQEQGIPAAVRPGLLRNYISFLGIAIVAASFTSIVLLILLEMTRSHENPYTDLVTFIFVPSILVFGLFVMLLGALIERRRRRRSDSHLAAYPILDLNDPRRRRSFVVFIVLAFLFLFMTAFGSYRAFEYTESVIFCGEACHSVMKPEYVAYQNSPHAQIRCVECHVGSGADAYVQAKFSGVRQLWGVATGNFNRPIHTPVHNMRSATETCMSCHWSEKYHGDKIKIFNHYAFDEANSLNQTRMLVKVGGGNPEGGPVGGIHWHMNVANEITFVSTDERRQVIPWVRLKDRNGQVTEYFDKGDPISPQDVEKHEKRRMDCIDCHNRPAHRYLSPNQALDEAFSAGKLDVTLPFLKAKAAETLSKTYATNDEAVQAIAADLKAYYQTAHPSIHSSRPQDVDAAVAEVQRIYQTYFFPEMKTDWQAHPDNIGHYNAQGCFRCHDGQHVSKEGRVIRNECNVCHTTLDQKYRGQEFRSEDGQFRHPVNLGDKNTWQCASCHKGGSTFVHPLNLGDISRFQCAECHKGQDYRMDLRKLGVK